MLLSELIEIIIVLALSTSLKIVNSAFLLTADALISTGMADLGYTYVNIGIVQFPFENNHVGFCFAHSSVLSFMADDCWSSLLRNLKVCCNSGLLVIKNVLASCSCE